MIRRLANLYLNGKFDISPGIGYALINVKADSYINYAVIHSDQLWSVREEYPAEDLAAWLAGRDLLIVLRFGSPPYQAVLGVPHHSSYGQNQICERTRPRPADENSALYALVVFSRLIDAGIPSKLVVVAHTTAEDPNKNPASPYCREVFSESADLLFECHGMSATRRLDLEVSAGSNLHGRPLRFGGELARALGWPNPLGAQIAPGQRAAMLLHADGHSQPGRLQVPALGTFSLKAAGERGMAALHLEVRPVFRLPPDGGEGIPPAARRLGAALASALMAYPDPFAAD